MAVFPQEPFHVVLPLSRTVLSGPEEGNSPPISLDPGGLTVKFSLLTLLCSCSSTHDDSSDLPSREEAAALAAAPTPAKAPHQQAPSRLPKEQTFSFWPLKSGLYAEVSGPPKPSSES